jgi:hypothetical protein
MSPGQVGSIAEGVHLSFIRAYTKCMAVGFSEATITLDIIAPPAEPFEPGKDSRNSLTIHVLQDDGCALGDLSLEYCFPDPVKTGAALLTDLLENHILKHPRFARLGKFSISGGALKFVAYEPGLNIEFQVEADPDYVAADVTSTLPDAAEGEYPPGIVVVTDPIKNAAKVRRRDKSDCNYSEPYDLITLPTQNLNLPASTQCFAGILLACEGHEASPAKGEWGAFSNCNTKDCVPDPCMRVLEGHGVVWVGLEKPMTLPAGAPCPKICYRFQKDAANGLNQLGALSLDDSAAGVAVLPVRHSVKGIWRSGKLIKLQLH